MKRFKVLCRKAKLKNLVTEEMEPVIVQYFTEPVEFRSEVELQNVYGKLMGKEKDPEKVLRLEQSLFYKIEESKKNQNFIKELNATRNQIFSSEEGIDTTKYRVKSIGDVNSFNGRKTLELVVERSEDETNNTVFKIQKRAVWNGRTGFDAKKFRPFKFDLNMKTKKSYEIVEEETDRSYNMSTSQGQGLILADALCNSGNLSPELKQAIKQASMNLATK